MSAKEDEPHKHHQYSDHQILYIVKTLPKKDFHRSRSWPQETFIYLLVYDDIFLLPYSVDSVTSLIFKRWIPVRRQVGLRGTDILDKGRANPTGQIQPAVCLCMALEF